MLPLEVTPECGRPRRPPPQGTWVSICYATRGVALSQIPQFTFWLVGRFSRYQNDLANFPKTILGGVSGVSTVLHEPFPNMGTQRPARARPYPGRPSCGENVALGEGEPSPPVRVGPYRG